MRACILTLCNGLNLGNRLQNYALYMALKKLSVEADIVLYRSLGVGSLFWETGWYRRLKQFIKLLINYKKVRNEYYFLRDRYPYYAAFNSLMNQAPFTMNMSTPFPSNEIQVYDYFVIGSDQVWNPSWIEGFWDIFFASFAPQNKRIAYAASFGVPAVPAEKKDQFVKGLLGMARISVREKQGAEIVRELIAKEVPVLVDPTLLLSKEEWHQVEKKPKWDVPHKYILTYFLGSVPTKVKEDIENVAKQKQLEVINVYDMKDPRCGHIGPSEFIYLLHHCEMVYTDSFHGTVFSILLNKPFYVINRVQAGMGNMNSRIDTLLELFHFQKRYLKAENGYESEESIEAIDFSQVMDIQKREQSRSNAYLRSAMHLGKELS